MFCSESGERPQANEETNKPWGPDDFTYLAVWRCVNYCPLFVFERQKRDLWLNDFLSQQISVVRDPDFFKVSYEQNQNKEALPSSCGRLDKPAMRPQTSAITYCNQSANPAAQDSQCLKLEALLSHQLCSLPADRQFTGL